MYLAPRASENRSHTSVVAHPRTASAMPITNAIIRGFIGHLPASETLLRRLEAHAVDLEGGIACAKQGVKAQEREF
jgi:hypothetical protein